MNRHPIAASQTKPVARVRRCKSPQIGVSSAEPCAKATLDSTKKITINAPEMAEQTAQDVIEFLAKRRASTMQAAGNAVNTGVEHKSCTTRWAEGWTAAGGVPGGYP